MTRIQKYHNAEEIVLVPRTSKVHVCEEGSVAGSAQYHAVKTVRQRNRPVGSGEMLATFVGRLCRSEEC